GRGSGEAVGWHTLCQGVEKFGKCYVVHLAQEHQPGNIGGPWSSATADGIVQDGLGDQWWFQHGFQCRENRATAVRPTNDRYPVGIDVWLVTDPSRCRNDVAADLALR